MAGRTKISTKYTWLQVDFLSTDVFNSDILPRVFLMQRQILINVNIFVAYVLNLPLNTQRSHYHSQRAGKWNLILAHDRRPIYRAPTYIAVPFLDPSNRDVSRVHCIRLKLFVCCNNYEIILSNFINIIPVDALSPDIMRSTQGVILALLMLETEYSVFWTIPCLLMPWLLKSPEHQQAWYFLCWTELI